MKPRIAITLGDPAGIGPEIVRKALQSRRVWSACAPVLIPARTDRIRPGTPSREGGLSAVASLDQALQLIRAGQADALATAPVSKQSFALAGLGFPGHTEFLASRAGVREPAMLMAAGPLRAILMTRHIALQKVPEHLSPAVVARSARLGWDFLRRHVRPDRAKKASGRRKRSWRMVLCGINPHAGDHGLIGIDEARIYGPALQRLRRQRIPVDGPFPADSVFPAMARGRWALAFAAYHDQAMIPLKLLGAERLVNITLGLPYIRTSPGHGTAFDIAGRGMADPRPMIEAILLAAAYSGRNRIL